MQNRALEVKVYVGIWRGTESAEHPTYVVLDSLSNWGDLDSYRWFETTLVIPLPQVAEHVQHGEVKERQDLIEGAKPISQGAALRQTS